jgi:hypothetical protein
MNTYANETIYMKKNELVSRTRGAVFSQRLSDNEIRVLCSQQEAVETCQHFNLYAVSKLPSNTYQLDKLGSKVSPMSVETVVSALYDAEFYHRIPRKNELESILQFCLLMFMPILIIPFVISWGIQDIRESIKKARIESVNQRIVRFTKAFREQKSKKISLNKRKYEMVLKAISYGISNQIDLELEHIE